MTGPELDEFERLWREGASVREIAARLGYSEDSLRQLAMAHRDRLPYRRRKRGVEERARWADMVAGGRMTRAEAARAAGVAYETMAKWVREAMRP